ncbi:MAG: flavodoxin family protein [Clostridiales bacterium]|nr:flavodoxin family protein [Clostridiales bacterium]
MKNVLIISTSLRGGSNSELLAKECAKGAEEAGNRVELLSLKGKKIQYCIGCLSCIKTGKCVQKDDAPEIMEKLRRADVLIFATPIYYYEMSGQMKTLLDRMNPLYSSDYAFREVYMIATAADSGDSTFEKAYNGLQGWVDCFPKAKLCGLVAGEEIGDPKDAVNHPDVMEKAYELGKEI